MSKISSRISKLEAQHLHPTPTARVLRHIVAGADEADRQAKIEALIASSSGDALHIIRTIVTPHHVEISSCPA